jgi:hypothetical protein
MPQFTKTRHSRGIGLKRERREKNVSGNIKKFCITTASVGQLHYAIDILILPDSIEG